MTLSTSEAHPRVEVPVRLQIVAPLCAFSDRDLVAAPKRELTTETQVGN